MIRVIFAALFLIASSQAFAQTERQPGKAVNINLVKFKPGKIERINEIENKYFNPAAEKVGIKPVTIRMMSGEWDRQYIFPMPGGMAELDFRGTKEQAAWMAELDRLAGGPGTGEKLLAEWNAAVDRQTTEYGYQN